MMGIFKTEKPQQLGDSEVSMAPRDRPSHQGENEVSVVPSELNVPDSHQYPTGLRLAAIIASIFIAMFLVALVCP